MDEQIENCGELIKKNRDRAENSMLGNKSACKKEKFCGENRLKCTVYPHLTDDGRDKNDSNRTKNTLMQAITLGIK